jgi:inorganic triphosphatase YgiF
MDEIELKFAIPRESRSGLERSLRRGRVRAERMQAIYFDTPDERLASHGASVRLRKEGRHWIQTAKATTADSIGRLEHNVPVTLLHGMREPALDLSCHIGTPVGEALRRALGNDSTGASQAALSERFRTDVWRIARTTRVRGARIEMSLDTGKIIAGDRSAPVAEFELELKSGKAEALMSLAAQWANRHGLWLSTISKAERGARLIRGETAGPPVRASIVIVGPNTEARSFLLATMESCLAQILGNASEIGAGAGDEEFVHQLRVGLRRLRTALRELRADRQGAAPGWEAILRSTFQELGRHRDHAIVLPAIRVKLDAAGVALVPAPALAVGARSPADVVRAALFQRTLLDVLAFTHDRAAGAFGGPSKGKSVRASVAKRLDVLHRCLARDAKRFEQLSAARQHRVRKRLKRLRYLSEFATPLFASADVTRYLGSWRDAQDALGECNDHRIATDAFRTQAITEPKAKLAVKWLKSRRRTMVVRCQRALQKASKTKPFWRG